ncbi:MAG: DUF1919 domain-containing protein [Lachnospiraceae bacterium]|nr:DUF1919 domain-containing protein [Lachnospiraceae bacterium]
MEKIEVVGVTSADQQYFSIDGYLYYTFQEAICIEFDYLVIAVSNLSLYKEMKEQAISAAGVDITEKIVTIQAFAIPGFDLEKYMALQNSRTSIIARNCWGGIISRNLGLQFHSPFINMLIDETQYLKLLEKLKYYCECDLKFYKWSYNERTNLTYPIVMLDDIELHFIHDTRMEVVKANWDKRVKRINYKNLFVMMDTQNKDILERFDKLPYEHKVCFVPFESDLSSACYLETNNSLKETFWDVVVNGIATGRFQKYNCLDMLCGEHTMRALWK